MTSPYPSGLTITNRAIGTIETPWIFNGIRLLNDQTELSYPWTAFRVKVIWHPPMGFESVPPP